VPRLRLEGQRYGQQQRPSARFGAVRELGHASTRAALIYLHSTSERQHILADAAVKLVRAQMRQVRKPADDGASGTKVARQPAQAS
jgi:hypothetical protein